MTRWGGESPLTLYTLKLDYNISSNDSLSVSAAPQFASNTTPNQALVTANFPVLTTTSHSKNGSVSIHYRHIFSPTFVNELMVGYAYTFGPVDFPEGFKALDRSTYGFAAGSLNPANNPYNVMPAMTSPTVEATHARRRFQRRSFMRSDIPPQTTMPIAPQM